jgi:histidine triad (HIT) family protein
MNMRTKKDCVFCKIGRGEVKEEILYQDEIVFVVRDINPRAHTHLSIITKKHYDNFSDLVKIDQGVIGRMAKVVEILVERFDLRAKSKYGYTWGFHCGGKESVAHVHAQLLAEMKEGELVL